MSESNQEGFAMHADPRPRYNRPHAMILCLFIVMFGEIFLTSMLVLGQEATDLMFAMLASVLFWIPLYLLLDVIRDNPQQRIHLPIHGLLIFIRVALILSNAARLMGARLHADAGTVPLLPTLRYLIGVVLCLEIAKLVYLFWSLKKTLIMARDEARQA